jgi:DNA-binding transcriptional LysR family regulator
VPAGHRWARRRSLSVAELATEQLIVLGSDHGTRRLLDAAMAEAGSSYATAAETDVPQVAQALAASGRGVAVVSDDSRYGLLGLRIRVGRAGSAELRVPLFAAWDRSHYAAEAIARFVEALASWAEERYGAGAR